MFQPIKREDIFSAKLLEAAKFNDNIKVYSKPSKSKIKQLVLRKYLIPILKPQLPKSLIYTGYFAVYSWKMLLTGMVSWPI